MEAVDRFLAQNDEFSIDDRCERFLMTLQPHGYLRRKETTVIATAPSSATEDR